MKINTNSKKFTYLLLSLIIIVGICRFSYGFFVQKESFHSDEAWSFGLANSYYEPYIQYNDDVTEIKNTDTWVSGQTFKDYFTVQKGQRFSFGSVYYNMSHDTHPPLYFFLLHFLCSFFPNQYIFSLGFIINMIAYIFMAIYIYKLLVLITKSRAFSLIGVLFSTFSLAMLCMTMYVRMYMLVATIAVIYTYINAKLFYYEEYRSKISSYILLGIISCIGAITDNFFLPYAFAITAVMCICWLIKRQFKTFFKYASCMLIGIGLSIAIFPKTVMSAFRMLFGASSGATSEATSSVAGGQVRFMPLWFQFKLAIIYINRELFGHDIISPYKSMFIPYLLCSLLVIFILSSAVYFLFRNDTWFINLKLKIRNTLKQGIPNFFKNFNFTTLAMFLSVVTICYFVADKTDLYQLGNYGDRYLMVCYPAAIIVVLQLLYKILNVIFPSKHKIALIILSCLLIIATIFSNMRTCHYFMKSDRTIQLESISKDADFIIVTSRQWLLVQYAAKLMDCNEVFMSTYSTLDDNIANISNHIKNKNTYIIVNTTNLSDEFDSISENVNYEIDDDFMNSLDKNNSEQLKLSDILDTCSEISYVNSLDYIGRDYINGFKLNVYKVN